MKISRSKNEVISWMFFLFGVVLIIYSTLLSLINGILDTNVLLILGTLLLLYSVLLSFDRRLDILVAYTKQDEGELLKLEQEIKIIERDIRNGKVPSWKMKYFEDEINKLKKRVIGSKIQNEKEIILEEKIPD